MPELPEVETTIVGLKPIVGSLIHNIKIHTPKLRFLIPKNILLLKNYIKIQSIDRRGKYIVISLSNDHSMVIHLGMSGRLILTTVAKFIKKKHDHFILCTNKEHLLVFNDPRRFGFLDYDKSSNILSRNYFLKMGIDALDKTLTGILLFEKIKTSEVPIKQLLLNQHIIAGIGNIYASEILFDAKISPLEKGRDLNIKDCNKIIVSIKKILRKAIISGGSSLRDYVSADGTLGNFQNNFKVYNKEGKKISGSIIRKIVQYGRASYYCPKLQKKK